MKTAHPAPAAVQERWRARGIWTDETLLDRLAVANGDDLAIVDGDVRLTIDALRASSARVAAGLAARGVGRGDIVCWQLPNWWDAVVLCWAIWRRGAIASPITPNLRAHEVGFITRQTAARCLVVPAS
ncbi:MAG TPA: AMP-binding protein, partial [Acidimicrobiia bacterium]|nr:AMP-binding protein [Acidimicrobiia bacterium]